MSRYVLIVTALFVLAALTSGCGPKYPNCENDTHCAEKGEYCVNGLCQQCRDNTHCSEGQECSAGKCRAIPGYCTTDNDCAANQKCRDNRCGPECLTNEECGENERCQAGRCAPAAECYSDGDCAAGMRCQGGKCVAARVECTPDRIHFDFDSHSIRSDARNILEANARCFKQMGNPQVTVEGHCDERGTEEYNLALGERRANSVRQYLERLGASNVRTLSYGENRPLDRGRNESAYSRNRRAEFQVNR